MADGPPKKRTNPTEGYQSAIASHLAVNRDCCVSYDESGFKVLSRCRSKHHLDFLEAMYIHVLEPVLFKQKSFVTSLALFKHSHSTHAVQSHKTSRIHTRRHAFTRDVTHSHKTSRIHTRRYAFTQVV